MCTSTPASSGDTGSWRTPPTPAPSGWCHGRSTPDVPLSATTRLSARTGLRLGRQQARCVRPLPYEALLHATPERQRLVQTNKRRIETHQATGLMTPAGQQLVDRAKTDGGWTLLDDVEDLVVPDDLAAVLASVPSARRNWDDSPAPPVAAFSSGSCMHADLERDSSASTTPPSRPAAGSAPTSGGHDSPTSETTPDSSPPRSPHARAAHPDQDIPCRRCTPLRTRRSHQRWALVSATDGRAALEPASG